MLRLNYFLIIALHTLYALLVVTVPFLVLSGTTTEYSTRLFIALIIILAAILMVIFDGCPLTFWQRRIEKKLWPEKRTDHGFIRENLARFGIHLSKITIRRLIVFFVTLDLLLLLF